MKFSVWNSHGLTEWKPATVLAHPSNNSLSTSGYRNWSSFPAVSKQAELCIYNHDNPHHKTNMCSYSSLFCNYIQTDSQTWIFSTSPAPVMFAFLICFFAWLVNEWLPHWLVDRQIDCFINSLAGDNVCSTDKNPRNPLDSPCFFRKGWLCGPCSKRNLFTTSIFTWQSSKLTFQRKMRNRVSLTNKHPQTFKNIWQLFQLCY